MKVRYDEVKEGLRYIFVGGLTTLVSLGSYFALTMTICSSEDGVLLQVANVISWILAVTFSYFANRIFVFRSRRFDMIQEIFSFYSSRLGSLLVEILVMYVGVTVFSINDKFVKLLCQFIVLILNYIMGKFVVFRKPEQ